MSKDYDPMPGLVARLEADNERLRYLFDLMVAVRRAQADYFRNRTKGNLIASKVAEADFDKAARTYVEGQHGRHC